MQNEINSTHTITLIYFVLSKLNTTASKISQEKFWLLNKNNLYLVLLTEKEVLEYISMMCSLTANSRVCTIYILSYTKLVHTPKLHSYPSCNSILSFHKRLTVSGRTTCFLWSSPVSVAACLPSSSPSLAVDLPSVFLTTWPIQMLQYLSPFDFDLVPSFVLL